MPEQLEHRRRTRREGVEVLVGGGATLAVLAGVAVALAVCELEAWLAAAAALAILTFVAAAIVAYAALNIAARSEFVCRLDDKTFECISPVWGCGESFKLPVADIIRIEKERSSDDDHRLYLCDKSGGRYWLTSNYDNPVDTFLERLRELNPKIQELAT